MCRLKPTFDSSWAAWLNLLATTSNWCGCLLLGSPQIQSCESWFAIRALSSSSSFCRHFTRKDVWYWMIFPAPFSSNLSIQICLMTYFCPKYLRQTLTIKVHARWWIDFGDFKDVRSQLVNSCEELCCFLKSLLKDGLQRNRQRCPVLALHLNQASPRTQTH